jgi:hypothetical protein
MITATNTRKIFARWTEIVAALFILLFVYTALSKLVELDRFRAVLSSSPLLGSYAVLLSAAVPFLELLTSALLFFPRTRKTGLWISFILMLLFTGYIGYMLAFASHLPCSCGGVIQSLSWKQHLLFNTFMTMLAAVAVFQNKLFIAIDRGNRKPVTE